MRRIFAYFGELRANFTLNFLAFLLMRLTGIALATYLFLHIYEIGIARRDAAQFDGKMVGFNTPFGWTLEYLLLLAVLYHMFNGLRLMAADFMHLSERQSEMLWLAGMCVIGIGAASAFVFFPGLLPSM
jgi:succinate dehydrogenase / fumarate reductase, cytochrome b subunit